MTVGEALDNPGPREWECCDAIRLGREDYQNGSYS